MLIQFYLLNNSVNFIFYYYNLLLLIADKLQELHVMIKPFILRRKKEQVL
jgi:SNF2 family DNA or RNA helicase